MEKRAIISIKSVSELDEEEAIEVVTVGKVIVDDEQIKAIYEESEISGMDGTTTYITIKKDFFIMERVGSTSTKMEFKKGENSYILYNTPYGMLDLHIDTKELVIDVNEAGGSIYCKYLLSAQGQEAMETELKINIKS